MSDDIRLANLSKLQDASYKFYWQSYASTPETEATFRRVFSTQRPMNFNENMNFYREQCGVMDITFEDRAEGEPAKETIGVWEDYYWQMAMRQSRAHGVIPNDVMAAGDNAIENKLRQIQQEASLAAIRKIDQHAANVLIKGPLTAGDKTVFNGSVPNYLDPYPGVIYDNLPYFDTAHVQSKKATSTTYANHTVSLAFSRANLKTIYTTMSVTNAKDRNGNLISINPDMIVAPPDLRFSIEREMGADYEDADLQPNVIAKAANWTQVYWRRLTDTDGWYVFEGANGGCKDVIIVENWKAPLIAYTWNTDRLVHEYDMVIYWGSGVRDWRRSYCCNVAAA